MTQPEERLQIENLNKNRYNEKDFCIFGCNALRSRDDGAKLWYFGE